MRRNTPRVAGSAAQRFGCLFLLAAAACRPLPAAAGTDTPGTAIPLSPTATKTVSPPTATRTRTPFPSFTRTPSRTPKPVEPTGTPCWNRPPEFFQPSEIPDLLRESDKELLRRSGLYAEFEVYRMHSYGGQSFGTESRWHKVCHEVIPNPNLYSHCLIERVTSRVHIMTGEVWGEPERMVSESLIRGREVWVRPEGGEWQLVETLDPAAVASWKAASRNAPFFFRMKAACAGETAYRGADRACFESNVPQFLLTVFGQELSFVDYLSGNEGRIWIDSATRLPREMQLKIFAAVHFEGQDPEEEAYNNWIEYAAVYHSVNEEFAFPNPADASA